MVRVLVVDDEKNVLTTLKIGLKRQSYAVYEAQNGHDAIAFLEREPCEVLVSDIRMMPMDGYTLAETVRERFPHIGIILMSAYGVEESQYETMERLSCTRLIKPFSVETLIEAIQRELGRGKKGTLLVLGDVHARKSIRETAKASGYAVEILEGNGEFDALIQKGCWGALLVDGESLNEERLRILNIVDRLVPNLPVILLARKGGDPLTPQDNSVSILDKEAFLSDPQWAARSLDDIVKK